MYQPFSPASGPSAGSSAVPQAATGEPDALLGTGRSLHDVVSLRLAAADQRYTSSRRALVDTLMAAGRPLTIPEIISASPELPQSSAYRNVTTLMEVGIVRRVSGTDDHGRFELAEELSGHHHHLVCASCGAVNDVSSSPRLERALAEAARAAAQEWDFEITDHNFDLVGLCHECRTRAAQAG